MQMRKQPGPTEVSNQTSYPNYYNQGYSSRPYGDGQQQGYYDTPPPVYSQPPPPLVTVPKAPLVNQSAIPKADPKFVQSGGLQLTPSPAPPQLRGPTEKQREVKEAAAVASSKHPVENETTYPTPHKNSSLLGIFFTDPGKFEGRQE
jgi:hypothetical protein